MLSKPSTFFSSQKPEVLMNETELLEDDFSMGGGGGGGGGDGEGRSHNDWDMLSQNDENDNDNEEEGEDDDEDDDNDDDDDDDVSAASQMPSPRQVEVGLDQRLRELIQEDSSLAETQEYKELRQLQKLREQKTREFVDQDYGNLGYKQRQNYLDPNYQPSAKQSPIYKKPL